MSQTFSDGSQSEKLEMYFFISEKFLSVYYLEGLIVQVDERFGTDYDTQGSWSQVFDILVEGVRQRPKKIGRKKKRKGMKDY